MFAHIPTTVAYSVCPVCDKKYSIYFGEIAFSIKGRSGLGPEIVRCASCNAVFPSGLLEWDHMTGKQKWHYWLVSMPYAIGMGITFSMFIWSLLYYFIASDYPFLGVAALFACFILAFQLFRIFLSFRRSEQLIQEPFTVSLKTWQTNLQFYCFGIALFFEIVFILSFL